MKTQKLNNEASKIVAQNLEEVKPENLFTALLRNFERAYLNGGDYGAELMALATACAQSVLKKCVDPQRKSAAERETVSNSGLSSALVAVKRGIVADLAHLDKLHTAVNAATAWSYDKDGYIVTEVVDTDAEKAATALQGETLSDGLDLVNAAALAILEQATHTAAMGGNFMEQPYTTRQLSQKVLIKSTDSAKFEDVETTPIQEVYRAVRREVQNSRAVQTDPRNGYLYLEELAIDPESNAAETAYRRAQKWADLGGYTQSGHYDSHGNAEKGSTYTADEQAFTDYEAILTALELSDRQAKVISLRMRGYGTTAIGTYLGIDSGNVRRTLRQIQEKCEKIGFTLEMWAEMTAEK